jgi:F-type H+-transporting ATPase subunit alpha
MHANHPEVAQKIIAQKKLDDALEGEIKKAIEEYKETISYKEA